MTTTLTPHFSLSEATRSHTAARHGLDNTPPILEALQETAVHMEAVRVLLGNHPITINSWYRSPAVNKLVGGSPTSSHLTGRAVDFTCPRWGTPLEICRTLAASSLEFDQLIFEGNWVHIGFDKRMRRQVMHTARGRYMAGLP